MAHMAYMFTTVGPYGNSKGSSGVGVPPRLRGTVPVAMPSARGRPARVISATLHLPIAIASAAWATCSR